MKKLLNSRPLSPHLQIYSPQLTSLTSIIHRVSGLGITFGLYGVIIWLTTLNIGEKAYGLFIGLFQTLPGKIVLWSIIGGFYYHLCNGIRHLCWDAGKGLSLRASYVSGGLVISLSLCLTLITIVLG